MLRRLTPLWVLLAAVPAVLPAQASIIADPQPPHSDSALYVGARLMKSGVVSQFDSMGMAPMGNVGDSVTLYVFADGEHLSRTVHAKIRQRQRFQPPASWRTACDEIAHPGWFFDLSASSRAPFGVIVPGVHPAPAIAAALPAARDGAFQFFHATVDSAWQRYRDFLHPATDRALTYAHNDFWGEGNDAGWARLKVVGVRGPNGARYAAFSFMTHDDYPNTPNTARTWVVDAWGVPVATINSDIDIYGTVDDNGIDAIVTSSGLIRWNGTRWVFPPVYSEEPCLYHQVMDPPSTTLRSGVTVGVRR